MKDGNWGHCKHCRYFGSPAATPLGAEEARCNEPTLSKFALRIYGSNGCNAWELRAGLSPDVERPRLQQSPGAAPSPI